MNEIDSGRHLAVKVVMMPRDTNPKGTIFGGVLLSYIDQAGVVGALFEAAKRSWPQRVLVTVAMNAVQFHEPVFVGDVVSLWTEMKRRVALFLCATSLKEPWLSRVGGAQCDRCG